jgi:hypothetical protein
VDGIAELLERRRLRIMAAEIRVLRLATGRAPHPFELTGVAVEHDHAVIAVAVDGDAMIRLRQTPKL